MMSPKTAFALTLAGVLLAGLPLLHFTHTAGHAHHHHHGESAAVETPAYADLRFDGGAEVSVLCRGQELCRTAQSPAEFRVPLPHGAEFCELEVRAAWQQEGEHAVSLRLEAPQQPTAELTRWAHGTELHDVYLFPICEEGHGEEEHRHEH